MSDLYVSNPPDNLLRLAFNRCQKDIDFMLDAFRDFVATIDKEESTKSVWYITEIINRLIVNIAILSEKIPIPDKTFLSSERIHIDTKI